MSNLAAATATADYSKYGASATNALVNGADYHGIVDYKNRMSLKQVAAAGGRITRVSVLTEYVPMRGTYCDISYVHATLPDGSIVDVHGCNVRNMTAFVQLKGELIAWAKAEGVFAKGLGLLDEGNWSVKR